METEVPDIVSAQIRAMQDYRNKISSTGGDPGEQAYIDWITKYAAQFRKDYECANRATGSISKPA